MIESTHESDGASRAPAVNRAIAILRLLANSEEPMSGSTIASRIGIVSSACQSILQTLEAEEFVTRDPRTLKYSAGVGTVTVARRLLTSGVSLRQIQEELDLISAQFKLTSVCNEVSIEGSNVVALSFGGGMFGSRLTIGRHVPCLVGASGRCFAAYAELPLRKLKAEFERMIFDKAPTFNEWLDQIDRVRATGIGEDDGQYIRGYVTLAVPIFENGLMRRSLAAIFASEQLSPEERGSLADVMRMASQRLST